MQKIINGIALLSGLVSLGVVVGGTWIYLEKDNMIHNVKTQMINGVTESITNALPGMLDAAMPELPDATGDVIKSTPKVTGGPLPF
ncbi:hypothetical protein [Synechococcus phage S-B43]|jgi:hypothetical protein|nr:plasmid stability protein [Synechococcus phage S-H68]QDH50727.1 hypothetical protein [Synechococcus phage S-B43]